MTTEDEGFMVEAALQVGFNQPDGYLEVGEYVCSEAALIAYGKACLLAGLTRALDLADHQIHEQTDALKRELNPILDAERKRFLAALAAPEE